MSTHAENAYAKYLRQIGQPAVAGDWLVVDQERINAFADVTEDHQFIHVDPELAKSGPFGTTIAHGFLTLSLLVKLCASIPADTSTLEGIVAGVNYGFDKIRFLNPVKVDSKIRATSATSKVELKGNSIDVTKTVTVEIEGAEKPALIAEWITRGVYS